MTDLTMLFSDTVIATATVYLASRLYTFLKAAQMNIGKHGSGSTEAAHYVEHVIAGALGFVGSTITAVSACVHLVLQNSGDRLVPEFVEVVSNGGESLLFVAAALFVSHMIKEEDPSSPFYYLNLPKSVVDSAEDK